MQRLSWTHRQIRWLAIEDRPGAIVLAEHAVDLHAELFSNPDDRLIALDALARDLIRMSRLRPEITGFLRCVDEYIQLVQQDIEATSSAKTRRATSSESDADARAPFRCEMPGQHGP